MYSANNETQRVRCNTNCNWRVAELSVHRGSGLGSRGCRRRRRWRAGGLGRDTSGAARHTGRTCRSRPRIPASCSARGSRRARQSLLRRRWRVRDNRHGDARFSWARSRLRPLRLVPILSPALRNPGRRNAPAARSRARGRPARRGSSAATSCARTSPWRAERSSSPLRR